MGFELLDSVTLPGDAAKPNEDAFAYDANAAMVFDGTTGLGENLLPGPSDAAWIAHFGARRLMAHLKDGNGAEDALAHALADAEHSFAGLRRRAPKERWEIPYSSMMLATLAQAPLLHGRSPDGGGSRSRPSGLRRPEGENIEFLWLGDCAALVGRPGEAVEIVGETFEKRAGEAARAAKIAAEKNVSPTSGLRHPELILSLRASRNRVGSGRYWLFGPDHRAAEHARKKSVAAPRGTLVLLASDGFLALASDYRRYDAGALLGAALHKGLAPLGAETRAIEEEDAEGRKYPRFKKSDDATAVLLRVA